MAADKKKSPGAKKASGNAADKQKGNGASLSQSEQKLKEQAMQQLRKEYFEARAAIPPQIPKFFNLQIDEWHMNQYGSMMPNVERTRMMRQGEWLGLALPHQDYDHDAYMAEVMPEFDDWRLKTMITEHGNQQMADKIAEEKLRLEVEQQKEKQKEESLAAAKLAAEKRAAILAKKKEDERVATEAELAAVDAAPVSGEETPQKYRRRVQLRQFRNQVERLKRKTKLAGKAFETPSLPSLDSDFYQPLPKGIYGSIQWPTALPPRSTGTATQNGDGAKEWEVTETFSTRAMEHHPQSAETHYFDPEASTRVRTEPQNGDPHQTVHPYLGKGPKNANWSPHPYLCDLDTLQQRFGSWRGTKDAELEPQVNAGNLKGERIRLGWDATAVCENRRYPPVGLSRDLSLSSSTPSWAVTSRPGTTQGPRPEPYTLKPAVRSAGKSTLNDVPLSYRNHPSCLADRNLKQIVLSKTMGQFVSRNFHPQPGDILILRNPKWSSSKNPSCVFFKTLDDGLSHRLTPGDQMVRIGKFGNGRWKLKKHFKMFKLVGDHRWMIIGLLENDRRLVPIERPCHQKVSSIVLGFWPRRGDLLLRSAFVGDPSQLDWVVVPVTGPAFKPNLGDVTLRVYTSRARPELGQLAGWVEMYVYDGVGVSWVFMGRDDCLLDSEGREA